MYKQAKFAQAEALFLRAMEGRVKVLGAEHAQTKDTEVRVQKTGQGRTSRDGTGQYRGEGEGAER